MEGKFKMNTIHKIVLPVGVLFNTVMITACGTLGNSTPKGVEGTWFNYNGFTVDTVRNHEDEPIKELSISKDGDMVNISVVAYNYQFTTPNHQPMMTILESTPSGKRIDVDVDVKLEKLTTNISDRKGKLVNNQIIFNLDGDREQINYDSKNDTVTLWGDTYKRSTGKDHLTNLAKQFKVDVQSASTQYFKEIGKIADPPVQFEMRYRFNDDILNKEKY